MKVLLTEDVYKHGVAGEVVKVADGFARNWLIPRGMAKPASKANLEQMANLREKASENRAVYNDKVNAAARQIDGVELVFGVKADINRRRISDRPIRELGRYDVPVRMGEVSPVLKIVVLREEEVAAYNTGQLPPEAIAEPSGGATDEVAGEAAGEPVSETVTESAAEAPAETGE